MDDELGSEYHLKKDRAGTGPFLHIFTLAKPVTIPSRRTMNGNFANLPQNEVILLTCMLRQKFLCLLGLRKCDTMHGEVSVI